MTDDSPNDLNTGHFGIPAYHLENSRWAFVRSSTGASFRQLGPWKTVVPPALHFPPPRIPRSLRAARQATKSIARDFPELVPASEHVSELEAVSAAATAAVKAHDATTGQLMSFGTITPLNNRAHLAKGLVALPAGECGNLLRLQLLSKEKRGWGAGAVSDSLCYLDCLSWRGDHGFWNQDAATIQQVCFAQSEKPGSFLAVRLPQRVALFHPAYRDRPSAAAKSYYYDLPPSVIDIHPFHSVWIGDTGNTPHADVAFNPHYQRQFAIVDQKSSWSVWDVDGTRRSYVVKRAASGNMGPEEDGYEEQAEDLEPWKEDDWARIMWVRDANTLLVCNRRHIQLIDLKHPTLSLSIPQVIDSRSTKSASRSWILDVKRHPLLDEKQFFVLTSTRLYLFAVTSDEPRGNVGDPDASIVLSWTHFRGTEDVTLQLYTQLISDEEIVVFIYSRVNTLITVYRLVDQKSIGAPYRSFGPTMLRHDDFDTAQGFKLFLDLNLARIDFKDISSDFKGTGSDYMDRDIHFYQLSAVFDDLSVAQTMLCTLGHDSSDGTLEDVKSTSWATAVKPVVFRSKGVVDSDDDDFIEPDGPIHSKEPSLKSEFQCLKRYRENAHTSREIFNFTSLYDAISSSDPSPLHHAVTLSESIDIVALVEEVRWRLDREENVEPFTLGTLQEYAEAVLTVEDIEDATVKLQELFFTNKYVSSLEPQRIASDLVLGFGGQEAQASSLSSVYDLVLKSWLASLPGTVPARTRQSKERSARRLAAGLLLASTRIRHSNDRGNPLATDPDSHENVGDEHSSPPPSSSQADWRLQSSQPSDSDRISLDALRTSKAALSNPLARLSKHLHMTNITPLEVPPSISQVLFHWELQADPSTYDWETTERAFADELELEQEGMPKKRERARRKKERQAKRQKRENELFAGKVETGRVESQPQLLRSSPGPAGPAVSSQPAPSQSQSFVVQSQVEPGKHGGRPLKKKKAKSRMSGF